MDVCVTSYEMLIIEKPIPLNGWQKSLRWDGVASGVGAEPRDAVSRRLRPPGHKPHVSACPVGGCPRSVSGEECGADRASLMRSSLAGSNTIHVLMQDSGRGCVGHLAMGQLRFSGRRMLAPSLTEAQPQRAHLELKPVRYEPSVIQR
uniref:Uncharacterized protein n=1 Tax=Knipowitschia caucasica TaxID=637954 RepID=A0AAV2KYE2_KNICA